MTGYSMEYLLDSLSLEQVVMLYDYGYEFEEIKATILISKYAEALSGKKTKKITSVNPDKQPPKYDELKAMFGDKVKLIKKENK